MDFITLDSEEFHSKIRSIVLTLDKVVENAAMEDVRASKNQLNNNGHNPYHLERVVEEANDIIKRLADLYPYRDERRKWNTFEGFSLAKVRERAERWYEALGDI